jgi:hypothetical protein
MDDAVDSDQCVVSKELSFSILATAASLMSGPIVTPSSSPCPCKVNQSNVKYPDLDLHDHTPEKHAAIMTLSSI